MAGKGSRRPRRTGVKRGGRVVGIDTELVEKLGRNDPCPAARDAAFRRCRRGTGRFDDALAGYYVRDQ